jgi:hypothetical protein
MLNIIYIYIIYINIINNRVYEIRIARRKRNTCECGARAPRLLRDRERCRSRECDSHRTNVRGWEIRSERERERKRESE